MKQCKINPAKPEFKHAQTIWKLIDKGLTEGLGGPIPGRTCVEGLVTIVMGEPHSAEPKCVMPVIAGDKININDAPGWSSDKARARGMKGFAIAQLGTRGMNASKYKKLFSDELIREFYPKFWKDRADGCLQQMFTSHVIGLLATDKGIQKFVEIVANELGDDLYSEMNSSDAISFVSDYMENGINDKSRTAICECGVRALTKMGSPGSKWLKKLRKG